MSKPMTMRKAASTRKTVTTPVLDTISIADELVAAGIEKRQAVAHAKAIASAVAQRQDNLATNDFVREEIGISHAELIAKIESECGSVRTELRTEMNALREDVDAKLTSIMRWMIGTGIALAALIIAFS